MILVAKQFIYTLTDRILQEEVCRRFNWIAVFTIIKLWNVISLDSEEHWNVLGLYNMEDETTVVPVFICERIVKIYMDNWWKLQIIIYLNLSDGNVVIKINFYFGIGFIEMRQGWWGDDCNSITIYVYTHSQYALSIRCCAPIWWGRIWYARLLHLIHN